MPAIVFFLQLDKQLSSNNSILISSIVLSYLFINYAPIAKNHLNFKGTDYWGKK
jgi:accessory gene regulator protein AgrB